jgi:hypothetical protein
MIECDDALKEALLLVQPVQIRFVFASQAYRYVPVGTKPYLLAYRFGNGGPEDVSCSAVVVEIVIDWSNRSIIAAPTFFYKGQRKQGRKEKLTIERLRTTKGVNNLVYKSTR